jgi:TetR/AcrR family transcriptional regulator, cholesterol catabolism regulator
VTKTGRTVRRERDKRLPEVLNAAVRVFWEKGYSAATIQDIADELGLLKGSVYHYVSGKEDLLGQLIEAAHAHTVQLMEQVSTMDAPPLVKLHEHFRLHARWYLDQPELVTVFFREWRFLTGERLQVVTERRRSYDRYLRTLLVQCQEVGDLATGIDVKYVSFFLLGALNTAPSWYRRDGRDSADTIARNFADLCVSTVLGTRSVLSEAQP